MANLVSSVAAAAAARRAAGVGAWRIPSANPGGSQADRPPRAPGAMPQQDG
jgi:hypothetical protein